MPPVRFEPMIPASARPQTYALDRAATGIGRVKYYDLLIYHPYACLGLQLSMRR
jgi:hypothetical protein